MFTVPCLDRRYRKLVLVSLTILICYWFLISSRGQVRKPLNFSEQKPQGDWQPVAGSKYPFSVYSAYVHHGTSFMDRIGRFLNLWYLSTSTEVTIIATGYTHYHDPVRCKFYFTDNPDPSSNDRTVWTPGTTTPSRINPAIAYRAVFIRCPLPFLEDAVPRYVSVVIDNEKAEVTNIVPISYKDDTLTSYQFQFSSCVLPTYGYNDFFHFLEWLEFHKMMGIEHFTMFNISIGPDMSCILNDLMERNISDVFPWHKNPVNNKLEPEIGTCVNSAAHNDCLHRHRGRFSKYMILVDLDEYIMPLNTSNYPELIDYMDSKNPHKHIAEYRFRHAFFVRSQSPDPQLSERCGAFRNKPFYYSICQQSFMMRNVKRHDFQPWWHRTKYIIKPEGVWETENHFVISFIDGYEHIKVPEDIAFVRHYRYVERMSPPSIQDRMPLEMGIKLINNLGRQLKYFKKKCNLNLKKYYL